MNTKDLTKGSIWKVITLFALPVFISNIFQQLYNVADSLIVGRFIGKTALAAVSSSGNLIFLFTSFFIGMSSGAGTIIANYFGKKNYDKMQVAIHTNFAFSLIMCVVLTILGVTFTPLMLKLMKTDPDVLPSSIIYFRYYFLGITGTILYNTLNSTLQAVGNSRRGLYYLVTSSLTNVGLDLLFVGVFKWGVWSAAVATTISQVLSASLCFIFLIKKGTVYQLQLKKVKINGYMLKKIVRFGIPSGLQNAAIGLANVIIQSKINSFGANAMAGCGSYFKVEGFAFTPINSFALAVSTFVSQNLGAKEYQRAKKGAIFSIVTASLLTEFIGLIFFIFKEPILSLFIEDESSADVIAYGIRQVSIEWVFYINLALSHSIAAVCRGSGRPTFPMIVMFSVWFVFRITILEILMPIYNSLDVVFYIYPLTWTISTIIYLIYFIFGDWVHGFERKEIRDYKKLEQM